MIREAIVIYDHFVTAQKIQSTLSPALLEHISIFQDTATALHEAKQADVCIVANSKSIDRDLKALLLLSKLIIVIVQDDNDEITVDRLNKLPISDYVGQNHEDWLHRLSTIIEHLQNNDQKKVLIVDDSQLTLTQVSTILETQNLVPLPFDNSSKALEYVLDNRNKTDLLIVDYEMPKLDGYTFCTAVRKKCSMEKLPILILSGTQDKRTIAKFLRLGANDYISKPFAPEEFKARVNNSLMISSMFEKVKKVAMIDHLTGLHNRTYFYSEGKQLFEDAKQSNTPLSICLGDIDNFKQINDTYGHHVGDLALQHVATVLRKVLRRSDLFIRFGGEEFVILLSNSPIDQGYAMAKKICKFLEKHPLELPEKKLTITISIGVSSKTGSLDEMLKFADNYMYKAKQLGKNRAYTEEYSSSKRV